MTPQLERAYALIDALDRLLTAYRIGKRPTERTLDELMRLRPLVNKDRKAQR